ncbi:MltA-interacting protein MipA [Klebsiella pneumoniae subsp. rhinoscleromatis]|nr:MltA-interacting protein MipA [Klebsiella pneumoniae subsp. rhinoscleromatis]
MPTGKFTLGAGVGVVEHPYKQYDADVYPVPVISYESENFWFQRSGRGYYLWNDTNDKLSITALLVANVLQAGRQATASRCVRLDKRKSDRDGRSLLMSTTRPMAFLRTTIAGDTLDNSNGY